MALNESESLGWRSCRVREGGGGVLVACWLRCILSCMGYRCGLVVRE